MGATEAGVHSESGCGGLLGQAWCRARYRRMLLLVVAVLLLGQFSINMLFFRNSDSLFYVNTTTPSAGALLFDSKLWWANSRLPWLQPMPVIQTNKTTLPSSSTSTKQFERLEKGKETRAEKKDSFVNSEKKGAESHRTSANSSHPTNLPHKAAVPPPTSKNNSTKVEKSPQASNAVGSRVSVDKDVAQSSKGSSVHATQSAIPLCPPVPPKLVGVVKVNKSAPGLEEQERNHPELAPGGHFQPAECMSRHKVAIIIPYRDRVNHLSVLLNHLHPILQRQQVDYTIFVVEQAGTGKFNRAMLMNVGALEALKHYPFKCFIFHDVDLLMEDDRNLYTCPEQPRHMSIAIDSMKYRLPYNDIFGGVSAMTTEQFKTVNGFSNKFWGWGGEDDDMSNRIKFHGFFISRYPANVGRYTMLSHKKDNPNPRRYQYLHEGKKRYSSDGLNNVKYRVQDTQLRRLYTWIFVDLFPS